MSGSRSNLILAGMLAGVVLGALLGYLLPELMLATSVVGTLFLNALKVITIPLIITSMVVGVSALGDTRRLGRVTGYTLIYFVATSAVAVVIGSVLALVIGPGTGVDTSSAQAPMGIPYSDSSRLASFVQALVPENLFSAMGSGQFLGIMVLALAFAAILATLGQRNRQLLFLFKDLNEVMLKAVQLIMYAAPVGLFFLVGSTVADKQESLGQLTQGLGWLTLTLLIGLIIYAALVLPVALRLFGKREASEFVGGMAPALVTVLGTSSPAAAFPVTTASVVERNKVDPRAASLALPFGLIFNRAGTAMFLTVSLFFLTQAFGVSLGIGSIVMIGLSAMLLSIGATGLPVGLALLLPSAFGAADLPPVAYGMLGVILAVEWVLVRFASVVDVWGSAVAAAVIDRQVLQRRDQRPEAARPREHRDRFDRGRGRFDRGERPERGDRPERGERPEHRDRQDRFGQRGPDSGGSREGRDRDRGGRFGDRHGRRDGRFGGRSEERERRPDRTPAPSPFSLAAEPEPFKDEVEESKTAPSVKPPDRLDLSDHSEPESGERHHRFQRSDRGDRGERDRGGRGERGERGDREGRDRGRFERRDRQGEGRGRFQRDRRSGRGPRPYETAHEQPVTPLPDDTLDLSSSPEQPEEQVSTEARRTVMPNLDEVFGDDRLTQPVDRATSENLEINLAGEPDHEEPASQETESPEPVQWGRPRHRRGEHREESGSSEETAPAKETSETPAETESPTLQLGEPTEFGRRPRRRIR